MATLNQGMNRYVPIVYRNYIAAFVLAPFALVLESHRESSGGDDSDKQWVAGTLLILLGCVSWSSSYVLQGAAISVAVERRSSGWAVVWDSRLFAPLYTLARESHNYVQGLVTKTEGPVFVTALDLFA
ncbi:hypothetical protein WN944_008157 [Citrus x changshan-huyou]|uniref:Uncharacterized protein n=1 Tax=Citrus x changshan-huyou TaxID=2935761 RepID=A0AAP0QV07_9ROSI